MERTNSKHTEQEKLQTSAKEHTKENYLIERKQIENSGIWIIGNKENGWFGAIGNNRITEMYTDEKELERKIKEKSWDMILRACICVAEQVWRAYAKVEANVIKEGLEKELDF